MNNKIRIFCFVFMSLFLVACGGGSDAPANTTGDTTTSNNWDELKWGEGSWQ